MTRRTYAYDPDLDAMVQIRGPGSNHYEASRSGLQIVSDLEPYRAAASDIACGGKRPMITGRRQHREFLQRNGYRELGNDTPTIQRQESTREERITDIRRAMGDFGSNTRD